MNDPKSTRSQRVVARRRAIVSVGAAILLGLTVAACIFDQGGTYQGGGRTDQGAKVDSPSSTGTTTSTATSTATSPPPSSTVDAAPQPLPSTDDAGADAN